ncbi:type VI secretion system protein [Paraburkholderia bannensis]|uniref:type VI secretion system protein n=1 Tax=Paraburkholderia bannensis TaxID=765414 RepID=UPI002AB669C5|nr:type VI secretion system protein [Paraburkholderia bannensis]
MTTTLIAVLLVLIALLVIGLVVVGIVRWRRTRDERKPLRTFSAAMRAAHAAMGVRDIYSIPRVLATGSPVALEALARGWRLSGSGEPGWFGRIWHDAEGILITEPGNTLGAATQRQRGNWARLTRALLRSRAGRPLDALLWAIPYDALLDESGAPHPDNNAALDASRTLVALQRQFGQLLPVYIVVTGCDALPGFEALGERLKRARIDAALGWASPYGPKRSFERSWIDDAFVAMRRALASTITELGTLDGALDPDQFLLPQRLNALREPLREWIEPALRGAADGTAPSLRGIWCVGAVPQADGAPVFTLDAARSAAQPLTQSASGAARGVPAFAACLWHDVLMPGQGLVQAIPRVLALRMRRHRYATWAALALGGCWLIGVAVAGWQVRGDARALASGYDTLTTARAAWRESDHGDAAAARTLASVADTFVRVPHWHLSTPFMPLSYFAMHRRLEDAQRHVLRGLVFAPLRERLVTRLGQLGCTVPADTSSAAVRRPQDLPLYAAGTQFVTNTAQIERFVTRYNTLVEAGSGNAVMLAQLVHEAVGVKFSPEQVADRTGLDEAVRETGGEGGELPFDAPLSLAARQRASVCFEDTFNRWFDQIYLDSALTTNAAQIQTTLNDLKAPGATPTPEVLSNLAANIDVLAAQVDTADHGWAGARGQELVPGMSAMFDTARQLNLIGAAPVAAVLGHEQQEQSAFAARWLASGNLPGVLSSNSANGLQLAADLLPLRDALRTLLGQSFVAQAGGAAEIRSVDDASVQRALAVLPAYRQYVAGPLAQAPETWRGALLSAAGNAAVRSMVMALSAQTQSTTAHDVSFAVGGQAPGFDTLRKGALDLIEAFDSLGRPDLAQSVALRVSDAAIGVLKSGDAQLQTLAPFRPVRGDFSDWNGNTGGATRAYGAASPDELRAYLNAQSGAIADTAGTAAGALDWLATQNPPLDSADARLVARWKALYADLAQYRAKSPASALVAVPAIVANQLDKMDLNTCGATLAHVDVPDGADIVSGAGERLVASARERCFHLQIGTGMTAYDQLRTFFARNLAGRFPFAADADAPAADLRQTAAFVAMLDANLADAQRGMSAAVSTGRAPMDAQQFLDTLARAKPWLDALVARGPDGRYTGLQVSVDWRVDRGEESGADQVIEWSLASGTQTLGYPSTDATPLRWSPGTPTALTLRWAKNSSWQPMQDGAQPTLTTDGRAATWSVGDSWALLRLVRLHAGGVSDADGSASRMQLSVPVHDGHGANQTARMYMRLTFLANGKTPLDYPDLPYAAPGMQPRAMTTTRTTRYPARQFNLAAGQE